MLRNLHLDFFIERSKNHNQYKLTVVSYYKMDFKQWLITGAAGFLGATGCKGNVNIPSHQDSGGIVQPADVLLKVPQISELEDKVYNYSSADGGAKVELLKQADVGKEFHGRVSLFVGNYTLGAESWFRYSFEHQEPVEHVQIAKLDGNAHAIRHNGENNSLWTLQRCTAAEDLYDIMTKAEQEGHLNEAGYVIGYVDYASSKIQQIFSSFGFFYGNNPRQRDPKEVLNWSANDIFEVQRMEHLAKMDFDSLSKGVRDELTEWVGRYGYDSLGRMARRTAPTFGKDKFYRQFGETLLQGYGLGTRS